MIVKTRCADDCGEVEVLSTDITLAVWEDVPSLSTYSFPCPRCERIQTWRADWMTQHKLLQGGVPARLLTLPEPGAVEGAGRINLDDLLDFNLTLRDTVTELLEEGEKDG